MVVGTVGIATLIFTGVFIVALGDFAFVLVAVCIVDVDPGNGGRITDGNRFGITFAVPVGVEDEVVIIVVVVVMVVVEKIGTGVIALAMIALCAAAATSAAAALEPVGAVVDEIISGVCTWHAKPETPASETVSAIATFWIKE